MHQAAPQTAEAIAFRATVLLSGRTATGIRVSAEVRQKAVVQAGDEVEVTLRPDDEPRTVTVPPDFAAALATDPAAQDLFNTLSYSSKQRFVLSIEGAKTGETRRRRIAKALVALREERP